MLLVRDFRLREGTQLNQDSVHLAVSRPDFVTCKDFLVAQVGKWYFGQQDVRFTLVRRDVLITSIAVRSLNNRFGTFGKAQAEPAGAGYYFLTLLTIDGDRRAEAVELWAAVLEEAARRWPDLDMEKFRRTALTVR